MAQKVAGEHCVGLLNRHDTINQKQTRERQLHVCRPVVKKKTYGLVHFKFPVRLFVIDGQVSSGQATKCKSCFEYRLNGAWKEHEHDQLNLKKIRCRPG